MARMIRLWEMDENGELRETKELRLVKNDKFSKLRERIYKPCGKCGRRWLPPNIWYKFIKRVRKSSRSKSYNVYLFTCPSCGNFFYYTLKGV